MLEKTLESPLNWKEIQPVHSEGDQPWDFFGRNDAKAETPVLWPSHEKSWLIGKDSDAGRDCGQEEKGTTEVEMAGWHHRLDGCEFEWILGVGDAQGGLMCCNSWGCKESGTTERLNRTELTWMNKDIKYNKDISLSGLWLCRHLGSLGAHNIFHTTPGPSVLLREPHSCLHQLPLPFPFLPATIKPVPPSSKITFVLLLQISPQTQVSYITEIIKYKLHNLLS